MATPRGPAASFGGGSQTEASGGASPSISMAIEHRSMAFALCSMAIEHRVPSINLTPPAPSPLAERG